MFRDQGIAQFRYTAGRDRAPHDHQTKILTDTAGEREFLIHQQDGKRKLALQPLYYVAYLLDDVGLNAFARLIEDEQARSDDERAGDGVQLLLTAGHIAVERDRTRFDRQ